MSFDIPNGFFCASQLLQTCHNSLTTPALKAKEAVSPITGNPEEPATLPVKPKAAVSPLTKSPENKPPKKSSKSPA
ncbi:hypothetical protein PGT21_028973 [Puccinia graminis f. sp. tritici]|uniref:Uncharacterized protein n=1 Tax=Puccinia graminis f. sp. tritici TaxID=56615 RepID=A0A5B0Q597_PUCGR|nr:hypothetical protein PGT21_000341 [Puccinia graminis f. sp. tritici]KAA1108114.1 hypothetical protein PGTUg99_031502 [Puccinia graminis f. sp. tritici]KAA1113349.1 hypothetical protein PGT21_028973 [Puccinia graminis f. sp. tritici]